MIISKIEIIPYKIKLKNSFLNSKREYFFKEGFIVELVADGIIGYGEVVFLEGFSNYSKQEVNWKVEELKSLLIDDSYYTKNDLFDLFKVFLDEIPAMHFAFDIALLDILSKQKSVSLAQYLNPDFAMKSIKVSTVYSIDNKSNNKFVKIKLLCKCVKDDINYLTEIFDQHSSDTLFRLDANRGYAINDLFEMCNFLSNKNIDYFEEPLIDMSKENLQKIKESFNIKIAIDETVLSDLDKTKILIKEKLIDVVVLKASIYGGIEKIFNLKKFTDKYNVELILSSSLENYVGNMAVVNLISAMNLNFAHGVNNQLFFNFKNNVSFNENSKLINIESIKGLGVKRYDP